MAALSFLERTSTRNGELFIPEESHAYVKFFVLIASVYYLAQGIEHVCAAVVSDVHGDTQDVTDITRIRRQETNTFHGKIDTHQGMFIPTFGDNTDRPFERNPSAYTSVMHHIYHSPW
jgi:hypothetical protein